MEIVSEDAKAILLLCGHLGGDIDAEPLGQAEYNAVVRWLVGKDLRPSDLLQPEHTPALAQDTGIPQARLVLLLKRGVQLGFAIEAWQQSGLWVVCRSDAEYPARGKSHLKDKAPAILFGAGDRRLLRGGGLAIVGSRDVDAAGETFAREIADWCGRKGMFVVSGGARGVDAIAMTAALEAGGVVIGVLAENLLRKSVAREARYALSENRLLLISPYHPEAGFSVGNAMGRNKLIYAMADYGLVVSADYNKGGTWEGAVEELKRRPARPVFVRAAADTPRGNHELQKRGAVAFPAWPTEEDPKTLLRTAAGHASVPPEDDMPLYTAAARRLPTNGAIRESTPAVEAERSPSPAQAPAAPATLYDAVLPVLLAALDQPATAADLARRLEVQNAQLQAWLKKAMEEGRIKKLTKPARFVRTKT